MKSKSLILSVVVALAGFLPQSKAALYDSFAVLAGSTVTSTRSTVLNGDLGAGTSISGFGPGIVTGTTYAVGSDAVNNAHSAALAAYTSLAGEAVSQNLTGENLGSRTLTPGVYHFGVTAPLTGTLTLNGDSNARFVFQIGSTLDTTADSIIVLSGGAQAGNVFWQVGTTANLGAGTEFYGSIFADTSINLGAGASMTGIAFANSGTVTLDNNVITAVPEPATFWTVAFCAVFGAWEWLAVRRRKAWSFLKMAVGLPCGVSGGTCPEQVHPVRLPPLSHGAGSSTPQGKAGCLLKQTSAHLLPEAIREVQEGNTFFNPSLAKQHRENLMQKLNIHDTAGLTRYAISAGIVESSVQLTIV